MKVIALEEEEIYRLVDERHNPPVIHNQKEENLFQAEIRELYKRLVESLSPYGEEGDYYGISDFAVRPDLRDRPTVSAPPAPHVREFIVTILTEKLFRSDYLEVLRHFSSNEAPGFRIQIDQDFDPNWSLTIFLIANVAWVHCTNAEEAFRLNSVLAKL